MRPNIISRISKKIHIKEPCIYWSNTSLIPSMIAIFGRNIRPDLFLSHRYDNQSQLQSTAIINSLIAGKYYLPRYAKESRVILLTAFSFCVSLIFFVINCFLSDTSNEIFWLVFSIFSGINLLIDVFSERHLLYKQDKIALHFVSYKQQLTYLVLMKRVWHNSIMTKQFSIRYTKLKKNSKKVINNGK